MGWQLEIAAANGGVIDGSAWRSIASEGDAAANVDHLVSLATLDPATLANGVYVLRLRASDLSGRTTEIEARILVDSAAKTLTQGRATDAIFRLGDHDLALTRTLDDDAIDRRRLRQLVAAVARHAPDHRPGQPHAARRRGALARGRARLAAGAGEPGAAGRGDAVPALHARHARRRLER